MNRKQFIKSQGATCKNWQWSWSFVNHAKRKIIFGAWDHETVGKKTKILSEDWSENRRGKRPAFRQSLEHIRLIEEEGYQLMTFPMFWKDSKPGQSKIDRIIPKLTKRKLTKVGRDWFASDYDDVSRTQITIGGKNTFRALKEIVANKQHVWWSCAKNTRAGDLLFFYAMKPNSAIVATGVAASSARPHKKWHYIADIRDVKIIKTPITRAELLGEFPKWGWPKQPRRATYLNESIARELQELAGLKERTNQESLITISTSGAGFGTSKHNREVEQAARKAIRTHFERLGYKVKSREKENIGYDFDVRRKREELHLELKGISGEELRFPITANEVNCAKSDTKFWLAVVTKALSAQRKVRVVSRKDFLKHFVLKPLAYFAKARSSLFA